MRMREYQVHPAFPRPLEVGTEIGVEIIEDDLPNWWKALDEEVRDRGLQRMWTALCSWGREAGMNEVVVDTFSCSKADLVKAQGFDFDEPSRMASIFDGGLCGPATLRSGSDRVGSAMIALFDVPIVQLQASASGRPVIEVRDMSWESMVAYAVDRAALEHLPFLGGDSGAVE